MNSTRPPHFPVRLWMWWRNTTHHHDLLDDDLEPLHREDLAPWSVRLYAWTVATVAMCVGMLLLLLTYCHST